MSPKVTEPQLCWRQKHNGDTNDKGRMFEWIDDIDLLHRLILCSTIFDNYNYILKFIVNDLVLKTIYQLSSFEFSFQVWRHFSLNLEDFEDFQNQEIRSGCWRFFIVDLCKDSINCTHLMKTLVGINFLRFTMYS